jgi:hypothetical protein
MFDKIHETLAFQNNRYLATNNTDPWESKWITERERERKEKKKTKHYWTSTAKNNWNFQNDEKKYSWKDNGWKFPIFDENSKLLIK